MTVTAKRTAAGVLAAVAVVAGTPTASAAPVPFECPADAQGCLFDQPSGEGDRFVVRQCGAFDLPRFWWDKAESYSVGNVSQIVFYTYAPHGGQAQPFWQASRFKRGTLPSTFYNATDRLNVVCG